MQGSDKNSAEQMLWDYRQNIRKIYELREMYELLKSVRGQDYETHAVNGVSDPVFNIVNTKLRLEKKIENLEKKIRAVENLIDELPIDELETYQMSMILTWRYINHMDTQTVIRVLGLTKTTYYRRKNALIVRAEKYIR